MRNYAKNNEITIYAFLINNSVFKKIKKSI